MNLKQLVMGAGIVLTSLVFSLGCGKSEYKAEDMKGYYNEKAGRLVIYTGDEIIPRVYANRNDQGEFEIDEVVFIGDILFTNTPGISEHVESTKADSLSKENEKKVKKMLEAYLKGEERGSLEKASLN